MDVELVRKLLPAGSIVGLSCNTPEQVKEAVKLGVDYTKNVTSPIIGTRGVGERLKVLDGTTIKAIAIGGIKTGNLWRTLHGGVSVTGHPLGGVAVVSEIVASQDPRVVATALGKIVKAFKSQQLLSNSLLQKNELISKTRDISPLVHQITNNVVATQSGNVTLAVGASPILATEPEEMEDLSKICGALLVNVGTMRADGLEGMRLAGRYANKYRKPIVFDPVRASKFRKQSVEGKSMKICL
ncbi:Hydroxyethylthiazole kinase family-domain-containing protein [Ephemerocybe angulata]|uniref:hydroxyethylthiazole kinase n=1 Tax=Ephemerocybe angulata TaxID=980116 RepID=A0A8H6HVH4_9AGAR|nr:Hydroxyethylthiazole kinase family-domain-containing protein [Tulosesus angulatus]